MKIETNLVIVSVCPSCDKDWVNEVCTHKISVIKFVFVMSRQTIYRIYFVTVPLKYNHQPLPKNSFGCGMWVSECGGVSRKYFGICTFLWWTWTHVMIYDNPRIDIGNGPERDAAIPATVRRWARSFLSSICPDNNAWMAVVSLLEAVQFVGWCRCGRVIPKVYIS